MFLLQGFKVKVQVQDYDNIFLLDTTPDPIDNIYFSYNATPDSNSSSSTWVSLQAHGERASNPTLLVAILEYMFLYEFFSTITDVTGFH